MSDFTFCSRCAPRVQELFGSPAAPAQHTEDVREEVAQLLTIYDCASVGIDPVPWSELTAKARQAYFNRADTILAIVQPPTDSTGFLRGHPIYHDGVQWRFKDTNEATMEHWQERPCGVCGLHNTPEGHDGCLGTLPGVMNACCGHGFTSESYIQQPPTTDLVRALEEYMKLFGGIDNGRCKECRADGWMAHRLADTRGNVQPCPRAKCPSNRARTALDKHRGDVTPDPEED